MMKQPPFSEGVKERASRAAQVTNLVVIRKLGVVKLETNCLRGDRLVEVAWRGACLELWKAILRGCALFAWPWGKNQIQKGLT